MKKEKLIVIVGPTGVGKTALSLQLAQQLHGEIISGDAMQVYRQLDIGTAKVTPKEKALVPHHLIDVADIDQRFTAFDFQQQGQQLVTEIISRQHMPLIVGGTGLYLQALLYDMTLGSAQDAEQNFTIRQKWQTFLDQHSEADLWQALNQIDPQAAGKISATNPRRVIRALEVYETTGTLFSQQRPKKLRYDSFIIGLNCERQLLYDRINQRVDQMVAAGLIEEARLAYAHRETSPQAVRGIGYKEFFPYFDGTGSLETAIAQVKQNSRHYAKRQLTWFRNQIPVNWYNLVEQPEADLARIQTDLQQWLQQ
ncbi:tRNA (adenosine(37)-N6)-dimethylallyltransferase MiaA [Latilactobacillus graminis]|uniref:tRNA dimethylallyltransferase n=2 Tax=Latilactobacillus graminis TaxID=60519 RepID=A0AA89L4J7_9LACO|nr:tRNA (adenosine(37)-N6)-dimethylallyltransferase MiaA [Latilactobacillus graminis]KRM21179.1 tRNA delta(2)-isopentenylpyrophosphate transferase [Latilactobacillus graminis DSM 20719]QFP79307.1 tRNA (adenosine(37)-N6)-dimethylallyltransferase MiaA [Latilactobacillus graminis]